MPLGTNHTSENDFPKGSAGHYRLHCHNQAFLPAILPPSSPTQVHQLWLSALIPTVSFTARKH